MNLWGFFNVPRVVITVAPTNRSNLFRIAPSDVTFRWHHSSLPPQSALKTQHTTILWLLHHDDDDQFNNLIQYSDDERPPRGHNVYNMKEEEMKIYYDMNEMRWKRKNDIDCLPPEADRLYSVDWTTSGRCAAWRTMMAAGAAVFVANATTAIIVVWVWWCMYVTSSYSDHLQSRQLHRNQWLYHIIIILIPLEWCVGCWRRIAAQQQFLLYQCAFWARVWKSHHVCC